MKQLDHVPALFEFGGATARTFEKDGELWCIANDVAKALGYVDPKQAVRMHCKGAILLKGVEAEAFTTSPRGITIIPEADVYRLIFRSNLPSAIRFQKWVCKEVLPAIRKTGRYQIGEQLDEYGFPQSMSPLYKAQLMLEQLKKQEAYQAAPKTSADQCLYYAQQLVEQEACMDAIEIEPLAVW